MIPILKKYKFQLFLFGLFLFRIGYGLCSEFWFEDEKQVYLLGLKYATTGDWPYYGPDIVYNKTQILGGLQGFLVGAPIKVFGFAEAPFILLNVLSFLSCCLMSWYICKRLPKLNNYFVYSWVLLLPWLLHYSTRIVNPSYVIVFSIPFILASLESLNIFEKRLISRKLSFFIFGFSLFSVYQLHMSYVMFLPFILAAFYYLISIKDKINSLFIFSFGCLIGSLTLLPTLYYFGFNSSGNTESVVAFSVDNFKNIFPIVTRYFSLASFEIPYVMSGDSAKKIDILKSNFWMIPSTLILLVFGFFQLVVFAFFLLKKELGIVFNKMKIVVLLSVLMLFLAFFFSLKGPSSHTFYFVLPLPLIFSFYCYNWLINKNVKWGKLFNLILFLSVIFHCGLAKYNFTDKSIYKDRQKVQQAIDKKDYKVLGERRADSWGYGY